MGYNSLTLTHMGFCDKVLAKRPRKEHSRMKKTIKRTLAVLLALLMTLGAGTAAASAAAPGASAVRAQSAAPASAADRQFRRISRADGVTMQGIPDPNALILSVKTPPDNTSYLLGFESPELSGLVITANYGGKKFDMAWDELYGEIWSSDKVITWELWVDKTDFPSAPGSVTVPVHCFCEQYTSEGGGWYSYETSSEGTIGIAFQAASILDLKTGETPIALDTPLDYTLTGTPDQLEPDFFVFTPAATGVYTLTASNYPDKTAPVGILLAADGSFLGAITYDLGKQPLQYFLEAGKTYYFAVDYVYSQAPVSPYGLTLTLTARAPAALTLDAAKPISVGEGGRSGALLTFTPSQSGDYCFRSQSANWDLYAKLFDSAMGQIAANDDGGVRYITAYDSGWFEYTYNFKIVYTLEAGKTYYLMVAAFGGDYEDYSPAGDDASVIVEKCYLRGAGSAVKAIYEEYPPFWSMFQTNYDEIHIETSPEYFGFHQVYDPLTVSFWYDFVPTKTGATSVYAYPTADETLQAKCDVRITYNWWQWLLVIFCFAWIWM